MALRYFALLLIKISSRILSLNLSRFLGVILPLPFRGVHGLGQPKPGPAMSGTSLWAVLGP